MLKKQLIKVALSLTAGLTLVICWPLLRTELWAWFLVPLYILGTVYGIGSLGPKLWTLLSEVSSKLFLSLVMKSTIGCLIMLIFLPIAVVVLLTIGWISGMIALVTGLRDAIQEEGNTIVSKRSLHRNPNPRSGDDQDDYRWQDFDALPGDSSQSPSLPLEDYGADIGSDTGYGNSSSDYDCGAGPSEAGDYSFDSYGDSF